MSQRGEDIYAAAAEGRFWHYSEPKELRQQARILQKALRMAKDQGQFMSLSKLLSRGKAGMENLILAAESRGGVRVHTYEKAAGDMLVHYWCKKHLPELRYRFDNNDTEAALTKWLRLAQLTLQPDVAMQVECWNGHNLADFFETLTLHLPSKVLNLLMNVSAIYY